MRQTKKRKCLEDLQERANDLLKTLTLKKLLWKLKS